MPTVTVNYLQLPSGSPVSRLYSGSITDPSLEAPTQAQCPSGPNSQAQGFGFGFWNINATLYGTATAELPPSGNDDTATTLVVHPSAVKCVTDRVGNWCAFPHGGGDTN
jgi:hypothetical protein